MMIHGTQSHPPKAAPPPQRALIVDDCGDARRLAQALVKRLGFSAVLAESGEAACLEFSAGSYALVLVDCDLPGMSGPAVARWMRSVESNAATRKCAIIAVSADPRYGDPSGLRACEIDRFLEKPLTLPRLAADVAALCAVPSPSAEGAPGPPPPVRKKPETTG